jgi:hypothetical protein
MGGILLLRSLWTILKMRGNIGGKHMVENEADELV